MASLRTRTAQGAQSRTKVPSPRPAVGEPRTRPRRCPCPGNARVAEDRPGSGRREPGGRHGRGGADPSRPRPSPRPAPRAAPQLPETEPSLLLPKLSAQRAPVENRTLQPVCPGWALRGGHWFAGARELPPPAAGGRTGRPAIPSPPPPRDPSPCSGAPSGGGSSSSDLRCWGLACLRRDMLLTARGPRAGQRHQRGGRRGRRGAAGRARGAGRGRRRRLRGPRMGLSN